MRKVRAPLEKMLDNNQANLLSLTESATENIQPEMVMVKRQGKSLPQNW